MDFTLDKYRKLLESFLKEGYRFYTVERYLRAGSEGKIIILRHDVDELAPNALGMAEVEHNLGINATYYFRKVRQSNNPEIIRQIVAMGNEIGYHYEDLSSADGNVSKAIETFSENLKYFRQYYPVKTVCMHGSSSSKHDNRDIWKFCKLEDFELVGEPYLSIDFNKIFYITDTGYAWDGGKFAVRDIVTSGFPNKYHSSDDIIRALEEGTFPEQAMMLAHTLWTSSTLQWLMLHLREFVRNRVKLVAKNNKVVKKIYSSLVKLYWKK